tara:strand:+ start:2398 stop:2592 length:195 start_codon:yes stop_codon:yes gene_type:complete
MHPSFLRQSKIANFSTLEQYQLYNEVQRAKREVRIESTVELAKHERKKVNSTKPGFGSKLDIYA